MDASFIHVAPESLHARVKQDLLARAAAGEVQPGAALPTEAALCRQYGVSRITIRRAIADLAARGLVSPKRGVGSFVTERADAPRTVRLTGFLDEARSFQTRILLDRQVPADADAARALDLPRAAAIRQLRSLVHFDGDPYTVSDGPVPLAGIENIRTVRTTLRTTAQGWRIASVRSEPPSFAVT